MAEIRSLILRLTERCDLRCAYCYAASERKVPDMTAGRTARGKGPDPLTCLMQRVLWEEMRGGNV